MATVPPCVTFNHMSTLKLALHKAKGTPLPEEWAGAAGDLDLK